MPRPHPAPGALSGLIIQEVGDQHHIGWNEEAWLEAVVWSRPMVWKTMPRKHGCQPPMPMSTVRLSSRQRALKRIRSKTPDPKNQVMTRVV